MRSKIWGIFLTNKGCDQHNMEMTSNQCGIELTKGYDQTLQ